MSDLAAAIQTHALIATASVTGAREITGTVASDEDGEPLPGVSVSVKGTSVGTITDVDGEFILNVPQDGVALSRDLAGGNHGSSGRHILPAAVSDHSVQKHPARSIINVEA